MADRYFLKFGDAPEREVTLDEFCKYERLAGFRPKMASTDPRYMTTPATASFGNGIVSGRTEYAAISAQ